MLIPDLSQQIKIVFFDIDDTLFLKNKAFLPATVAPAIRKLKARGIIPAIATGRTRCSFPPELEPLIKEAQIDLFVTMNGQYVSYQGKPIASYPIDPGHIANIVQFLDAHQIDYAFVANEKLCVSNISAKVKRALDPITTNYAVDKQYFKHNPVYQLLAFYGEEQDALVKNANILTGLKTIRWHEDSIDIFDEHGSKARGINIALEYFGYSKENAMAFGDGLNDIEMLSLVGVGVAMGNGHQQLKAVADYVTDTVEDNGIYRFLIKTNLIDETEC